MRKCTELGGMLEMLARQSNPERERCLQEKRAFQFSVELTNKCLGSCKFCFSASDLTKGSFMPTERVLGLIDEAKEMDIMRVAWGGGDPILHPDWYKIISCAAEKGFSNQIAPNPMSITKKVAKRLCELPLDMCGMHIGSLNQEVYNKDYYRPDTLSKKIQGYHNLLEAGFPPDKVMGLVTLTSHTLETVKELVDWFVDQMGAKYVCYTIFRMTGFAAALSMEEQKAMEPSLYGIRRAYEHLARKLGDDSVLMTGTSDASISYCKTYFCIKHDGRVIPCSHFEDYPAGNIHDESLASIFQRGSQELLFDFEVEGFCGEECENREICFGCRANALRYAGDKRVSDPKCWWNPANREYIMSD